MDELDSKHLFSRFSPEFAQWDKAYWLIISYSKTEHRQTSSNVLGKAVKADTLPSSNCAMCVFAFVYGFVCVLVRMLICVTRQNKPDYKLYGFFLFIVMTVSHGKISMVYQQPKLRQNDMSRIIWCCALIRASQWQVWRGLLQSTAELSSSQSSDLSNQEENPLSIVVTFLSVHLTDSQRVSHLSSSKVQ